MKDIYDMEKMYETIKGKIVSLTDPYLSPPEDISKNDVIVELGILDELVKSRHSRAGGNPS